MIVYDIMSTQPTIYNETHDRNISSYIAIYIHFTRIMRSHAYYTPHNDQLSSPVLENRFNDLKLKLIRHECDVNNLGVGFWV